MFNNLLLVAAGGAAGSVLRYLLQLLLNAAFPAGTLVANITGCFLIGLLWGYFAKTPDETGKLLLMTGFCGGFTTLSAFSHESIRMLMEDRWMGFLLYTGWTIIAGLLATFAGYKITH
jgi:fluoride exporter